MFQDFLTARRYRFVPASVRSMAVQPLAVLSPSVLSPSVLSLRVMALRVMALSVLALSVLALVPAGCTGFGNSGLPGVDLGDIVNDAQENTLKIRVVNSTNADMQLTLRVDGENKLLSCTDAQGTCNFTLTNCPTIVELVRETRTNTAGEFVGGRSFEGVDGYSFVQGEFTCSGQISFNFTTTNATAQAF